MLLILNESMRCDWMMKISLILVADIRVGNCCVRCGCRFVGGNFLVEVGLDLSCDWRMRSFASVPLGIVVDNPDQDSGHLPTDPYAGLFGCLKSLQARSMKMSAQLFVTPWREPMVELWVIVVESSELIKVVALIVDTPWLGPKAELVWNLCALCCDMPSC